MQITPVDAPDHQAIFSVTDPSCGLKGFIAIHSTLLGPAAGGLRMRPYASTEEALEDVKRLSEGMTYKNAAAGLNLGGGKAVILGDPAKDKTPELLRSFGRAIDHLNGRYITAEDMGMSPADMAILAEETPHVAGLADGPYASGNPSPITARGIFNAIRIAKDVKMGNRDLAGTTVAVQGLGHVGWYLSKYLHQAGASLIVTDIDPKRMEEAVKAFGAQAVATNKIYTTKADIFAPCAIGGILNSDTIPQLQVQIVAGGANNQLATAEDAARLHERDILYAPDFVANGGGIINVATEIEQIADREAFVAQKLAALEQTMTEILQEAERDNLSPDQVAISIVKSHMRHAKAA